MEIRHLAVGPLQVNCYILGCPESRDALIIDPGEDARQLLGLLREEGWNLRLIVNTHGHFDHIGGNRTLVEETSAELAIHRSDLSLMMNAARHASIYGLKTQSSPEPTRFLEHGERIRLGSLALEVIHTPGHTPGGICLYEKSGHLFAGDSLFAGSVGRTDLPGGDHDLLVTNIRTRLLSLPPETLVYPGHGPETSVGREKIHNPFVGEGA